MKIGQSVAHYRITAAIGAGGMGEVYRATDTRLNRAVALKVLPPEMAASPERLQRFQREARAVAALNDPHVVTIYSVEEADGVHFLTMELVEGEPLDRLIPATGMAVTRLLDIAAGIADALVAAHDKGIVHRDLKPANVMLTKAERVKVLDFGLAKMSGADASPPAKDDLTEMRTREGVVMGTMPYMSPEQLHGLGLDHRTDIFSLGVMLYEMASGERPFAGDSSAALASAILRDTPRPLVERRKELPEGLIRVINRCLEKSASDRFPSARDLRGALSGVTHSGPARSASSEGVVLAPADDGFRVAVRPFKCVGTDADLAALADGLSDEIATGLSRFRYLSVVSGASASHLGEAAEARQGARYVLDGTVRMGGSAIRVSAQLVDTRSGAQIWSEMFNRDLQASSFFGVQDDLSARIVATVADSYGVLVHSMRAAMRQKDDGSLTPAEWQFQYFAYSEQVTPATHAALKSRVERALKDDDRQSDLWACLANIYVDEYAFGFGADKASLDRALTAARRAVELDRANQFALVALAHTHFFRQDIAAFRPVAERAMALNPLNTHAIGILGVQIVHTGEFQRGAAIVRRAMELNANHAGWLHFAPLWEHFLNGEYEQALECANRVDMPGFLWPFLVIAAACGHLGRRAEAEAAVRDLLALDPEFAAHARSNIETWHFASGLLEPLLEGLRRAGLSIPVTEGSSDSEKRIGTIAAGADRTKPGTDSGQVRTDEGFGVAVMPFKFSGARSELEPLAAGLTEDILTGFSRFTYLRVRSAGKEVGARYVMEGTLRQSGTKVRLAVQLVDTESGARIWAETYERPFDADAAFELQDDLVHRIVGTCADQFGVLARSISEAVRGRDPGQLGPYEALMRGFGYHHRLTETEHAAAREVLERAVDRAPSNADCRAMLAWVISHEYGHGFNTRPDSLDRALVAARRAVDLAPSSPLAQQALAVVSFFRKERAACLSAAERAIALNPLDTGNEAMFLITFSGEWDRGCALIRRAMDLNPHHPRWFELTLAINEYRLSNYRATVDEVMKANAPEMFWSHALLAAAHAQLGELTAAGNALRDLLVQKKDFPELCGELLGKWFDPQLATHWMEGLRKAGLEGVPESIAPSLAPVSPKTPGTVSGAVRTDEGFWVAVLPFKFSGANDELTALAEGLSEDIVTGLSRFSYLRVIARGSTAGYSSESGDVRAAGKALGARYVMEGSLRQAGTRLRLAVQLVDADSGAHLWAENFERAFNPETLFELQDDLVPRIVSTVADMYGVLPRSMSEALRGKPEEELTPHEAVLCAFGYMERVTPAEHARVRRILERAVSMAPNQGNAWAMLANLYWEEYAHELNPQPDPLGRALAAARKAVDAAPSNNLAHYALACTLFFQKDLLGFRAAAERALELNRMDASVAAFIGNLLAYAGDWDRGCAVVESAMQLNPRHPGWYWFANFNNAYRQRDYRGALEFALKINLPGNFFTHAVTAAAYGQLGMREAARKTVTELLAIRPGFAEAAREEFGRWNDPEFVEHILEGLRKAGLEIASENKAEAPALESSKHPAPISGGVRAEEGFWVAVLPFKNGGNNADLSVLAEGLTEEIVTGLSRFSYLRVIARGSTARFKNETIEIRAAGMELGARYVMEGSLRQAGSMLRVAVQLVDASTGAHLWAETYERTFRPEALFALQDDLVPRIVSTVADWYGVLPHTMSESLRSKAPDQLSPYEAVLRSFGYYERMTAEEHAAVRAGLERAVEQAPGNADCWAMLSMVYGEEYRYGFNAQPDPLGRSVQAARRAADATPSNHFAWLALALALFYRKEFDAFRSAAERAITLNPMDGYTLARMGLSMAFVGDWEQGCELAERATRLNPNHPGWYWAASFNNAYRKGDYRGALSITLKMNMPGFFFHHMNLAAVYGQLGEREAAGRALHELLVLKPDFALEARAEIGKFVNSELVEHVIDGLRKAGLDVPSEKKAGDPSSGSSTPAAPISGAVRAEEGFWVAVLPFKCSGANAELTALAEGLTEDIVTGLSRFSYLRVIARSSTVRYASESVDVRSAGKELGARYVMEGSLRQAGTKLRLAVQLVDATTGAHLWAENYERGFSPESIFELQDELVPRIVSTVADSNGILARSMSDAVRSRDPEQLTPYEAVLRSFGYGQRVTPEELTAARFALELAVRKAPNYGDAWAMLAWLNIQDYAQGFNLQAGSLTSGLTAAQRAVDEAPSNHLSWSGLAQAHFFHKEFASFRNAAERVVALNPMDGNTTAFVGELLTYAGDWERGLALAGRAKQLNPNYPGWYWYADFYDAYRRGDYRGALDFALRINLPGQFFSHAVTAAALGQLGQADAATKAVRELLKLRPDFASVARKAIEKWWEAEYIERMIDGWRKAGLEISDEESSALSTSPDATPAQVSIAVLPFSDMSAAKDQEYLCEGMAEEIMNALVPIAGIRVASRTSAIRAAKSGDDLGAISRALSVGHVLEGSVRSAGTRLRVTAQLTDVASGYQLWSERFDREAIDVFAIQDEIAAGVVEAVKAHLAPGARPVRARSQTHNLDAYRSYLKGRHLRGIEDFAGAMSAFEEAVRLDPAYAPSWTGLAEITVLSAHMGMIMPRAACTAARKMLATAKELQGESADGLHVEAFVAELERRWDAMETTWRRALELQPDHVLALGSFAITLCSRQRLDEALPLFERAREADPLASFPYTLAGWGLLMSGRLEDGLRQIEDALSFEKEDASAIGALCIANVALGRFEQAIDAGERGVAVTRRAPFFLGILGWALAAAGRDSEAREVLEELRARPAGSPTAVSEAWLLGAIGETDDAFAVLARAEEEHQGLLCYTGLSGFDSLRSDPRFAALLGRLELSA